MGGGNRALWILLGVWNGERSLWLLYGVDARLEGLGVFVTGLIVGEGGKLWLTEVDRLYQGFVGERLRRGEAAVGLL